MINCGFVSIIGLPNAGKSTLLNALIGEKLTIVSEKPQTTRQAVSGILTTDYYQLVFYDAPGFVESKPGLFAFLASEVVKSIEKSDHLLVLVANDQKESREFDKLWAMVKESGKSYSIVVTKSDLKRSDFVTGFLEALPNTVNCSQSSVYSKETDEVQKLLSKVATSLPEQHHPMYDPDMISLEKTRDLVADFIREQCFLQLGQEIPYGMAVIIKSYQRKKGLLHIEANIIVEKENHKAIVIGKGGQQLKKLGQSSRKKIEELLGEKIFLGLFVTFKKNWMKRSGIMKELGYHHE